VSNVACAASQLPTKRNKMHITLNSRQQHEEKPSLCPVACNASTAAAKSFFSAMQMQAKIPHLDLTGEERSSVFPDKQSGNLPATNGPVFLATDAAWKKLQQCSEHQVNLEPDMLQTVERPIGQAREMILNEGAIRHWVLVPSYNRYSDADPRQMLIDWADAVSQNTPYVRVIVVRSEEQQVLVSTSPV